MKRFQLLPVIMVVLAVSLPGCGRAPDNSGESMDKSSENVVKTSSPKVVAPTERPVMTEKPQKQAAVEKTIQPIETALDRIPDTTVAVEQATYPAGDKEAHAVSDVIVMKNTTAFSKHTRPIVMFGHKKHTIPAPDGYGLACGECHHDKNGKPVDDLKPGDPVADCIVCHNKTEKPKRPPGMPPEDWQAMQIEYYYGAVHANCINCHKAREAGPTKCNDCHPGPERP